MNNPRSGELRELIARLSDGVLSVEEADRLNELLQADPIGREEYLDHMLVDGLLEREFGGAMLNTDQWMKARGRAAAADAGLGKASVRRWARSLLTWRVCLPAAAVATIACSWLWWGTDLGRSPIPIRLFDSGFESGSPMPTGVTPKSAWYGDEAESVGRFSGISPLEGGRMLRFVRSRGQPEGACELYQIVDLRPAADAFAGRPRAVEASAFFNAIPKLRHDGDCAFGIAVFAFSEDPSSQPHVWPLHWEQALTFGGSQARADGDSTSWQQVITRLQLPADAKYLIVQVAVIHTELKDEREEFPGQFADNVRVNLVSAR